MGIDYLRWLVVSGLEHAPMLIMAAVILGITAALLLVHTEERDNDDQ